METLIGEKVLLRNYREEDLFHIYAWTKDPMTTKWMGRRYRTPRSFDQIQNSVRTIVTCPPADGVFYAIAEKSTETYVGGIDLTSIDWIDRNGVLSIVIGEKTHRRKGYATEAITLMLYFAFEHLHLHKIELNVYAGNTSAVQCYKKLGFSIEGIRKDHMYIEGAFCDLLQMRMLETEYNREVIYLSPQG